MAKLIPALAAATALCGALGACRAHLPVAAPPDGMVRIECAGEAGDEVRVAGSFDGWQQGRVLARGSDGRFVGNLALPPGFSTVACVRRAPDGTVISVAPANSPVVEADGFGGENGLFEGPRLAAPVTSKE